MRIQSSNRAISFSEIQERKMYGEREGEREKERERDRIDLEVIHKPKICTRVFYVTMISLKPLESVDCLNVCFPFFLPFYKASLNLQTASLHWYKKICRGITNIDYMFKFP